MKKNIEICYKSISINYIKNFQNNRKKKNIHATIDSNNIFDNETIVIHTFNQKKEKIIIGCICKNDFNYTNEANKLNEQLENEIYEKYGHFNYDAYYSLKNKYSQDYPNFRKMNKTPLYSNEQLTQLISDINNNLYYFSRDDDYYFLSKIN